MAIQVVSMLLVQPEPLGRLITHVLSSPGLAPVVSYSSSLSYFILQSPAHPSSKCGGATSLDALDLLEADLGPPEALGQVVPIEQEAPGGLN